MSESNDKRDETENLIALHKVTSEELRHTATIIWQYSIAIVGLQGGALALNPDGKMDREFGQLVVAIGFALSIAFSAMLIRQANDRSIFVKRILAVEKKLRTRFPDVFEKNSSSCSCFRSYVLAWLLLGESVFGFVLVICQV